MDEKGNHHPTVDRESFASEGIDIRQLDAGDNISLIVGTKDYTQEICMQVGNPLERSVLVESRGVHFRIEMHMTHFSGCIPYFGGAWLMNINEGLMVIGAHPSFGPFVYPPIKQIFINGADAADYLFNRDHTTGNE